MSIELLQGRPVAARIWEQVSAEAERVTARRGRPPSLAVVQAGEDPSASAYTRQILRSFSRYGLEARLEALAEDAPTNSFRSHLEQLGNDPTVDAVLVQTPLPPSVSLPEVIIALEPEKDAEGVHPANAGLLWQGAPRVIPSTPAAGMEILDHYGIALAGRLAVVIGRSNTVGKPLAQLLLARNATVIVAHSQTRDLSDLTRRAELLAVAVGRPAMVGPEMVADGAVVLDFGTTEVSGTLVGDVDFDQVSEVASFITPVPGGIGPVTIAMLAKNVLALARSRT